MDWTSIIITLLSGSTLAGLLETIRFRKQNEKLKTNEVRKSDIDLVGQMAELLSGEMKEIKASTKTPLDDINNKLDAMQGGFNDMHANLDEVKIEVCNIKNYLNGPYKEWLKKNNK